MAVFLVRHHCPFTFTDEHRPEGMGQRILSLEGEVPSADPLYLRFGCSAYVYVKLTTYLLVWLKPNQANRR